MSKKYDVYPGYPSERLHIPIEAMPENFALDLPDGPWTLHNAPLPDSSETDQFIKEGYTVDSCGRPLHPHLVDQLGNPETGVVTGKGAYWNWGPNYTVDPIVVSRGDDGMKILLIQRGDTHGWALPGGFIDKGEPAINAAVREVEEESGLTIEPAGHIVYEGVVSDLRTTAHAWAETTAILFEVDDTGAVHGADDAEDARWFPIDALPDNLHGSHGPLIERALHEINRRSQLDAFFGNDEYDVQTVSGGHMAYDHRTMTSNTKSYFIKSHDPRRFSDPFREKHSRDYLKKEHLYLTHVSHYLPTIIPGDIALVGDTDLVMEALHPDSGWQWRAPRDEEKRDAYVRTTLEALRHMSSLPLPEDTSYKDAINETFDTHWREGWDDITDNQLLPALYEKACTLSENWSDDRKKTVITLFEATPSLIEQAAERRNILAATHFAHHDMRQSNIAWHPESGVRFVDWSWADPGLENADATTFLIDIKKSGYDVTSYQEHFNKDHALMMIGFWLGHTLWETRDASTTVRQHQLASACAAFELLTSSPQRTR